MGPPTAELLLLLNKGRLSNSQPTIGIFRGAISVKSPFATISLWFRSTQTTQGCVFDFRDALGNGSGTYYNIQSELAYVDGKYYQYKAAASDFADGNWHHGILFSAPFDARLMTLGANYGIGYTWIGCVDEFIIYTRKLSADEIRGLYLAKSLPKLYAMADYRADALDDDGKLDALGQAGTPRQVRCCR